MMMNRSTDWALAGKRVGVAMSGGVDSAVTAALLKERGADVFGLTMLLQKGQTPRDAQAVADKIGIPLRVVGMAADFESCVVSEFADSYQRGETPNPCVRCNQRIKFGALLDIARSMELEALATGHYARRVDGPKGVELHQAFDLTRDQSYFLFALTRAQLEFARFPLAERTKDETRALAKQYGLPVADKPDSQDICFVPGGDYVAVLNQIRPGISQPGEIVDQQGNVLGRHEGTIGFTIGQRKGLNLGLREGENNEPLYVLRVEPDTHRVVVGPREALKRTSVTLHHMNWLGGDVQPEGVPVSVKLRSTQQPVSARFFMEGTQGRVVLDEPVFGVSPGQVGVIYHDTQLLGGGWIA